MADTIPGRQIINVGVQNQATGSDDLYTAFSKVETNFENLFTNASPYLTVSGSTGILVTNPSANSLSILNTGVTRLTPGTGITLDNSNGNVTISVSGSLTGVVAGVTNVGIRSTTLNVSGSPIISRGNIVIELPAIPTSASFNPGTYVSPTLTVDQYGRIVGVSNISTAGTVTSVAVTAGDGIGIAGSPVIDSGTISITNTGVTKLTAGPGISLSGNTGAITISGINPSVGTVTRIDVQSQSLTITGSPITSSGTLSIELPANSVFTKVTGANIVSTGPMSAAGNLTVGNIITTGSISASNISLTGTFGATSLSGNLTGNVNGIIGGTTPANGSFTNVAVSSNITVTGNVGGNNLSITNFANVNGNLKSLNATLGNLTTSNYFTGNGSLLFSINGANVTGDVGSATTAGTVTIASQGNITSVGTLTNITTSGNANIKELYGYTNGNIISANANIISLNTTSYTMFGSHYTVGNMYVGGGTFGLSAYKGFLIQTLGMPVGTPIEGTFAIDSANSRIGIYYSGVWRYAALTA
jgi:hypothetical protein